MQRYAAIAALGVTLTGTIVLLGWALHIDALKSVLPAFPTMKANTALGLLLCGAALWLLHPAAYAELAAQRRPGVRGGRLADRRADRVRVSRPREPGHR